MAVDMKFCSYFVFLVNINRNEKKKEEDKMLIPLLFWSFLEKRVRTIRNALPKERFVDEELS